MTSSTDLPIGIITSLTGGNAATETSIHRGAVLAIGEINAAGGAAGRRLVPIIADYGSDISQAPSRARKLLVEDGVRVCVGGYTSASRVAMAPMFASHDALLLYPTYYEGLEQDPNVIYTGAVPNQFLVDYMTWVFTTLGRRVYLLGSDYVYPRTAGALIQRLAADAGATVVAERYVPLGALDFEAVISDIAAHRPDVIISNVVGSDSVPAFYRALRSAGHDAERLPIAATVTTEVEVQAMGIEYAAGHYMAATYFQTIEHELNAGYVARLRARFGADAVSHVDQVSAYNAVWLFARALERAQDMSLAGLRAGFVGARFDGNPEGAPITVLPNQHTVHAAYIGRTRPDGQYEVIERLALQEPDPFPARLVARGRRPASLAT